jgi:hypothetical protein
VSAKSIAFSGVLVLVCLSLAFQRPAAARQRITIVDCGTLRTYAARMCSSKAYNDPTHWSLQCLSDGTMFCCHVQDNGPKSCSQVGSVTTGSGGVRSPPPNVGVLPPPNNPPPKIGVTPPKSGGTKQPPGGGTTVGVKPVASPPSNSGNQQSPSGGTETIFERGGGKH